MTIDRIDEMNETLKSLKKEASDYHAYEQAVKLMLNSIYGAFGNPYFYFFNVDIAETITLQGKDAILYTEELINKYFREFWHKDVETHKEMGITVTAKVEKPVGIYIDTDSVIGDTVIHTDGGSMTIAELYQRSLDYQLGNAGGTLNGHESVNTDLKTLNWSESKELYYAPIRRIIRHKVSKKKWKLKLKSGKEVIVTNDHSLIVFRNGKKLEVKPSEILKTDKVLSVYG
jgi:DNA polymerase elongation subunit (family B)